MSKLTISKKSARVAVDVLAADVDACLNKADNVVMARPEGHDDSEAEITKFICLHSVHRAHATLNLKHQTLYCISCTAPAAGPRRRLQGLILTGLAR